MQDLFTTMKTLKNTLFTIVLVVSLIGSLPATAVPRTWEFTIEITSNAEPHTMELPPGTPLSGTVSVDDAGRLTGMRIDGTDLLEDLSFSFADVEYTDENADSGFVTFNSPGDLVELLFGNDCSPGQCLAGVLPNADTWLANIGTFKVDDDMDDFSGATKDGNVFGLNVRGELTVFMEEVLDPLHLLDRLADKVAGVGPGRSLAAKVLLARTFLAVPDVPRTCKILGAFVNEVEAQRGKKIDPASLADELTADAQTVLDGLACD